jgi:hypothetical protein
VKNTVGSIRAGLKAAAKSIVTSMTGYLSGDTSLICPACGRGEFVRPTQDVMTRFPVVRQNMRVAAVTVPLFSFSGFLLYASGHELLCLIPLILGFIVRLAFPYYLTENLFCQTSKGEAGSGVFPVVWFLAIVAIWFWFMDQPEIEGFERRVMHGEGFWDGWLIAPVAVLTVCWIIWAWRRVPCISDTAINSYYATQFVLWGIQFCPAFK